MFSNPLCPQATLMLLVYTSARHRISADCTLGGAVKMQKHIQKPTAPYNLREKRKNDVSCRRGGLTSARREATERSSLEFSYRTDPRNLRQ